MSEDKATNLSDLNADILWYLLNLTKVNRFFTHDSFKEFLIRYLLITEHELDKKATDFIENGILISGFIGEEHFKFTLTDLINCIGFSASNSKFNLSNKRDEFIETYTFKPPNIKIIPNHDTNKPTEITTDALAYGLMGLHTLFKIDSFSIQFKREIKTLSSVDIAKIENYVTYVMSQLPKGIFLNEQDKYEGKLNWMEELYDSTKEIRFNVKESIAKDTIAKICTIASSEELAKDYLEADIDDEDFDSDFATIYEHINFAYGVKHGYITLSNDPNFQNYIDPYFQINYDLIMVDDFICLPTKTIYENWRMEDWIDLIPL
jgi:hypothetical protein